MRTAIATAGLIALLGGVAHAQRALDLDGKVTGTQKVVVAAPEGAARVRYDLDGITLGTAPVDRRQAELRVSFPSVPLPQLLTLTAYAPDGSVIGTRDQIVNAGGRAAYLDLLEPTAGSRAVVCAHLPDGDAISRATLTRGGDTVPLAVADDDRCPGIALAATIPRGDLPYIEALVTTASGLSLSQSAAFGPGAASFGETITVRELQYLVRPVDRDGATVPDLPKDAFRVVEDRRQLTVASALPVREAPIDLAIVLDATGSTFGDDALERALVDSVLSLFDPTKDRVTVYAIGERPIPLLSAWTSDRTVVEEVLHRALRLTPRRSTDAFDTIEEVLYRFQAVGATRGAASAMVVMSDGWDSLLNRDRAMAQRRVGDLTRYAKNANGVQIYPISVQLQLPVNCGMAALNNVNDALLDTLASSTGGERFSLQLSGNPEPFLRRAEENAMTIRRLKEEREAAKNEEAAALDQQIKRVTTCMNGFVKLYREQERLAKADTPVAEMVRDTVGRIGQLLRSQYVVSFTPSAGGLPRERRLEFSVDDPRVAAVKAPFGAYY